MLGSVDGLLEYVHATGAALSSHAGQSRIGPGVGCLMTALQDRPGARCAIDEVPGLSSIELPFETSAALFRVAHELLTNVMRHASASQVHMRLYQDGAG